jgi:hypothetical protein
VPEPTSPFIVRPHPSPVDNVRVGVLTQASTFETRVIDVVNENEVVPTTQQTPIMIVKLTPLAIGILLLSFLVILLLYAYYCFARKGRTRSAVRAQSTRTLAVAFLLST